jgi:hypothetical protein
MDEEAEEEKEEEEEDRRGDAVSCAANSQISGVQP